MTNKFIEVTDFMGDVRFINIAHVVSVSYSTDNIEANQKATIYMVTNSIPTKHSLEVLMEKINDRPTNEIRRLR